MHTTTRTALTAAAALALVTAAPLAASATGDHATPAPADTVELSWLMPEGASDTKALWPQAHLLDGVVPCGRWAQLDVYLASEAARFAADGILTNGEDHKTDTQRGAISWRFVYGGDCPVVIDPPVIEPPVIIEPPVVVDVPVETPVPVAVPIVETAPVLAATGPNDGKLAMLTLGGVAALLLGLGAIIAAKRTPAPRYRRTPKA